jgi:hypothetical protein
LIDPNIQQDQQQYVFERRNLQIAPAGSGDLGKIRLGGGSNKLLVTFEKFK